MGEFELIERFFRRPAKKADLGIGDDCALLSSRSGMQLAVSSDMLIEGRHFLPTVPPVRLGHKCLAVNLSDLAACGATPRAFTLSLALPHTDEQWLSDFSKGLLALADAHDCELIGGDTTRGPLCISITILGDIPHGAALLRSGAKPGDDIYVSGHVGDARLALEDLRGNIRLDARAYEICRLRMEKPVPRVTLGIALRGIATSAADISDGLLGDLGHILTASHVGAVIDLHATDSLLKSSVHSVLPIHWLRTAVLSGGDDYELVFTAPPHCSAKVKQAASLAQTPVTKIGSICTQRGILLQDASGKITPDVYRSFDHFS